MFQKFVSNGPPFQIPWSPLKFDVLNDKKNISYRKRKLIERTIQKREYVKSCFT